MCRPRLPEVQRSAGNTRKAIDFVLHNPGREALQVVRRAKFEFAHDHDGIEATETLGSGPFLRQGVRNLLSDTADWYFFVLLGVAAVGLVVMLVRDRRRPRRASWWWRSRRCS